MNNVYTTPKQHTHTQYTQHTHTHTHSAHTHPSADSLPPLSPQAFPSLSTLSSPLLSAKGQEHLFEYALGRQVFLQRATPSFLSTTQPLRDLDLTHILGELVAMDALAACVTVKQKGVSSSFNTSVPGTATAADLDAVLNHNGSLLISVENAPRVESVSVLGALTKELSAIFKLDVSVHVYVTPAYAQALTPHNDPYDVLVLQTRGVKHWTLCDPGETSLPSEFRTLFFSPADLSLWQSHGSCASVCACVCMCVCVCAYVCACVRLVANGMHQFLFS
jgi:hypothetical protein